MSNIRFLETSALYLTAAYGPGLLLPPYFLAGVGAGAAALTPIIVIRACPPPVRFSGISFSYNLAYASLGGLTPLFVSWITHFNGINPAHYVAIVTAAGLLATFVDPVAQMSEDVSLR